MISSQTPCAIAGFGHVACLLTLTYSDAEPFAISLTFEWQDQATDWAVSRDLVVDALLEGVAGIGDAVVSADGNLVRVGLVSPDGAIVVTFPQLVLADFIAETLIAVPAGEESEHLNWEWLTDFSDF